MILVIASAIALAMTKGLEPPFYIAKGAASVRVTASIEQWGLPWLIALAWASLTIRLRHPRPSIPRLWRQPGAIAMLMTVVATFYAAFLALAQKARGLFSVGESDIILFLWLGDFLGMVIQAGTLLIVGAWLALALTRRVRRESGWIDGLGFAVGGAWIVASLILVVYPLIF